MFEIVPDLPQDVTLLAGVILGYILFFMVTWNGRDGGSGGGTC
jgi:hypothetical protein